jgi:hypothetical protein
MQSSQSPPNQYQTWDYYVQDGIVPILESSQENSQAATIAAFLQLGTIPQLPTTGIPWVEFFTGEVQFNQIDSSIKSALNLLGLISFYPQYDLVNGNLVAKVVS